MPCKNCNCKECNPIVCEKCKNDNISTYFVTIDDKVYCAQCISVHYVMQKTQPMRSNIISQQT